MPTSRQKVICEKLHACKQETHDRHWLGKMGWHPDEAKSQFHGGRSLLAVFQQGRQVWSGAAAAEVVAPDADEW